MKKYEITYLVTGLHTQVIEVDDDMTIEEIEEMCYNNFPPVEEYEVDVVELKTNEDDDEEEA